MVSLLLAIIYLAFIGLGLPDSLLGSAWPVMHGELNADQSFAGVIAMEPEVLVLDEPESNLDFRNQLIVLDAMSALAARGVACIFNTHYPAHALQRAGKSLLLFRGGESISGSTPQVVTEENIRRAFGVDAMIGEVETPHTVMKNIVPVGIAKTDAAGMGAAAEADERGPAASADEKSAAAETDKKSVTTEEEKCLASITIISDSNDGAGRINALLREYNHLLIGRMGLPHRSSGKYIITVMLEGPASDIKALTHKLGLIPDISVKTTYA